MTNKFRKSQTGLTRIFVIMLQTAKIIRRYETELVSENRVGLRKGTAVEDQARGEIKKGEQQW